MKIGYVRVSTPGQDFDMQKDSFNEVLPEWEDHSVKEFKTGCDKIFQDVMSGSTMQRPGWIALMDFIREGDTLVLWSLDRMGRTMVEMLKEFEILRERKVTIKILYGTAAGLDTSTDMGRLSFIILSALTEMERKAILERTNAGRERAMKKGVKFGRKVKEVDMELFKSLVNSGKSRKQIREIFAKAGKPIGRNKFYECLKAIKGEENEKV